MSNTHRQGEDERDQRRNARPSGWSHALAFLAGAALTTVGVLVGSAILSSSEDAESKRQDTNTSSREAAPCQPADTDETSCVVCQTNRKDTLLQPCRHLCLCSECAAQLRTCPVCRVNIENRLHNVFV